MKRGTGKQHVTYLGHHYVYDWDKEVIYSSDHYGHELKQLYSYPAATVVNCFSDTPSTSLTVAEGL